MRFILIITGLALATAFSLGCMGLKANGLPNGAAPVYEGAAMGYRGMIHVRVGFEKGTITEIAVVESVEDRAVGGAAIEELTDLVLMYNTTEVDAVSGATETSRGFLGAIENAIMGL
jgi:fumarate reductase flavoprotein subunit